MFTTLTAAVVAFFGVKLPAFLASKKIWIIVVVVFALLVAWLVFEHQAAERWHAEAEAASSREEIMRRELGRANGTIRRLTGVIETQNAAVVSLADSARALEEQWQARVRGDLTRALDAYTRRIDQASADLREIWETEIGPECSDAIDFLRNYGQDPDQP